MRLRSSLLSFKLKLTSKTKTSKRLTTSALTSVIAFASPVLADDALAASGEVEFQFVSIDGDTSTEETRIYFTGNGTYDFGESPFGLSFGADLFTAFQEGATDRGELSVFAAVTFGTAIGTFAVGAPRSAVEQLMGNEFSDGPNYSSDQSFELGVLYTKEINPTTDIAASLLTFSDDYYGDAVSYSFAATKQFGKVHAAVGVELDDYEFDDVKDEYYATLAYKGSNYVVGIEHQTTIYNDISSVDQYDAYNFVYIDYQINDAIELGASVRFETEINDVYGNHYENWYQVDATYAFENGVFLRGEILVEDDDYEYEDETFYKLSVGYNF